MRVHKMYVDFYACFQQYFSYVFHQIVAENMTAPEVCRPNIVLSGQLTYLQSSSSDIGLLMKELFQKIISGTIDEIIRVHF